MSNTYKKHPYHILRRLRHKQQLAEHYGAKAERDIPVRIQDREAIVEGAWADKVHSCWYSDRKEQGRDKVKRINRRRKIRKNHQKYA